MPAAAPAGSRLDTLAREHAEWRPWLALLDVTSRAIADPAWAAAVPAPSTNTDDPLVAVAEISVDGAIVDRLLRALLRTADEHAIDRFAPIASAGALPTGALLEAAIAEDNARLAEIATTAGVDVGALTALASLLVMPLLHACRAAWAATVPATSTHGACPICGGWPTLAEARGLEQARRLRCARCGGDWRCDWLRCPYCGVASHDRLGSLVSDATGETRKVDTCLDCRGYIKTLTTIMPIAPASVALEDLATVDLDVAALSHEFRRPSPRVRAHTPRVVLRDSGLLRRLVRSWS